MTLRERLREGRATYALWLELGSPAVAEALVHAGFRHLLLDNEHGPASWDDTAHALRAIEAAGGEAIVRIPQDDLTHLRRLLELGVRNILAPMVDTAEAARRLAEASRYPPHGRRGFAGEVRASRYGLDTGHTARAHEELCLMVQIESRQGVENAQAIAAVEGVDALFVGPYDLSGSFGKLGQTGDAEVSAAIEEVERVAKAANLPLGTVPRAGVDAAAQFERGYALVVGLSDVGLVLAGAKAHKEGLPGLD